MKDRRDKITSALLKVALGGVAKEVCEEYTEVDGQFRLTKRKETKKVIPPDLKAVQLLLAGGMDEENVAALSDEELEAERQRLLRELAAKIPKEEGQVCDDEDKPVQKRENESLKKVKMKTGGTKQ